MKFTLYFYFVLFFCKNEGVEAENNNSLSITQEFPSHTNYLENVTIQDVLDSGIDENKKIEKKIVEAATGFTSDSEAYSAIRIIKEHRTYVLPGKRISIDLGSGNTASLDALLSTYSKDGSERHATFMKCNSAGNATVSVGIPTDLRITPAISVNLKSEKHSIPVMMHVTLSNVMISKNFTITANASNSGEESSEISYDNSEVRLNIDSRVQKNIYNNMDNIFSRLENNVKEEFEKVLNEEIRSSTSTSNSMKSFCYNKMVTEQNKKKTTRTFYNNFNNRPIYIISNEKSEIWKDVTVSAGPIIIDGLSHFNSLELRISENQHSPNPNEIIKDLTAIIKTDALKGKFQWQYKLKHENTLNRTFTNSFSIDFLQFESAVVYLPGSLCSQNLVNVNLGEIRINDSVDFCENENFLVNSFLSEYLSTTIKMYLQDAVTSKINSIPSFSTCPINTMPS